MTKQMQVLMLFDSAGTAALTRIPTPVATRRLPSSLSGPSPLSRGPQRWRIVRQSGDAASVDFVDEGRIRRLLNVVDDDETELSYTSLSHGYCNDVVLVEMPTAPVVVKMYSHLSLLRTEPGQRGIVDKMVEEAGLGPSVLTSTEEAIAHCFVEGRVLREMDMHTRTDVGAATAKLVAAFHSLPVPEEFDATTALLWKQLDRMLQEICASEKVDALPDSVNLQALRGEVEWMAEAVKGAGHKSVVLAHGDQKPSNIMLVSSEKDPGAVKVQLIDLELSGPNYRGFDLMKLFRTNPETYSDSHFVEFLAEYCRSSASLDSSGTAVREIEAETKLFEPLTWLEAAIFFALMVVKGNDAAKNVELLVDRWERYKAKRWMVEVHITALNRLRDERREAL